MRTYINKKSFTQVKHGKDGVTQKEKKETGNFSTFQTVWDTWSPHNGLKYRKTIPQQRTE